MLIVDVATNRSNTAGEIKNLGSVDKTDLPQETCIYTPLRSTTGGGDMCGESVRADSAARAASVLKRQSCESRQAGAGWSKLRQARSAFATSRSRLAGTDRH